MKSNGIHHSSVSVKFLVEKPRPNKNWQVLVNVLKSLLAFPNNNCPPSTISISFDRFNNRNTKIEVRPSVTQIFKVFYDTPYSGCHLGLSNSFVEKCSDHIHRIKGIEYH
ncbi:hypothetical protein ACTA71_012057 [Dictyostelium dimigraforme]